MQIKNILFTDSRVIGYGTLIDQFSQIGAVFVLNSESDGLNQMVNYLKDRNDLDAIHIISHGSQGSISLGNTVLSSTNLFSFNEELRFIGASLSSAGDLLLYGCNVGQNDEGAQFIESLSKLTSADVAASTDISGPIALGGDSALEVQTGSIETTSLNLERLDVSLANNAPVLVSAAPMLFPSNEDETNHESQTVAPITVINANEAPIFTISGDGKVTTDIGTSGDYGRSVVLQSDGKIVVAGSSSNGSRNQFALVRYNANGSLDSNFGTDGKVTTPVGSFNDVGQSVVLQSDGKIVVAGYVSKDFALVRYNANGSLDTTFDGDGKVTTSIGPSTDRGQSVVLQSDGKIVVAGYSLVGSKYEFAMVRYNVDGSLDTNFGTGGKVTTAIGTSGDYGQSVMLQSDGKIILAGSSNNGSDDDFALVRYNTNGSLDTTFDDDGKVTTPVGSTNDVGQSVVLQSDGKIVVAGYSEGYGRDFALVRYNANGSLDITFDSDGKLTTHIGSSDDYGQSLVMQSDGKVVLAGYSDIGERDFFLVRYNADGSLDTTFNRDGKVKTQVGSDDDFGQSVALQSDGKIVVAGYSINDRNVDFALVRYNVNGNLDTSFDFDSKPIVLKNSKQFVEHSPAVVLGDNLQVLDADLAGAGNYAGASLKLERHDGAIAQDQFSAAGAMGALTQAAALTVSGTIIGTVTTNSGGTLVISFNSDATQGLVNQALQGIAYANISDAPPASVQIDWSFSDGNIGNQGAGGALSATGSTTVNITAVNDAPVLIPTTPVLITITEDDTSNTGQTVASLLGSTLSDGDANAEQGIAVYGAGGSYGKWQYNTNTGTSWVDVGSVSPSSALLIRNTDLVRFLPDESNGTTATLGYYGWDQTSGNLGAKVSVVSRGGTSAFSESDDTVQLKVSSVNDAPVFFLNAGDGKVTTPIGSSDDYGQSIALQSDGKIVVAGYTNNGGNRDFALARYNSNGSLDTTFSGDGKVTTPIGLNDDYGYSVVLQSDGKIVVAGTSGNYKESRSDFALVRYNAWGGLDSTFSGDGKVTTPINDVTTSGDGYSVVLQSDGKIVVAGSGTENQNDFALVRYNADGSLDQTFSGDGQVTTPIGSSLDLGKSVALQSDGKIVVAGYSSNGGGRDFALVRYNANGSLDTTFDGDGKVTTPIGSSNDFGYSVALQSDGKIVVAGYNDNGGNYDFALVRYNSNGSLDSSFDGDGKVTTPIGSSNDFGYSVALQGDGKIVVAGYTDNGGNMDFALVRYNSNGSLDNNFDDDGKVITPIGSYDDRGFAVALQSDGKIVVAGISSGDFALVRYNANGSLDISFDFDSKPIILRNSKKFIEHSSAVVLEDNLQIRDADLTSAGNYAGASLKLERHGGASAEDHFSAAGALSTLMQGAPLIVSGTSIGTVTTSSGGSLVLSFNSNATQSRVDQVLQGIAYANSSDAPPASVQIDWDFNDGNSGSQGASGASSATGSTTVTITAVNDAPVLAPAAPNLPAITEDDTSNAGQTVASLIGTTLNDGDANAEQGIAVYGVSGSYGKWQYNTNAGSSWVDLGTVSSSSALLLRSSDLVRFLPDGSNGTTATLVYHGWDQTSGSVGTKVNVSSRGDTTAFSAAGDAAQLTVSSVGDVPVFKANLNGHAYDWKSNTLLSNVDMKLTSPNSVTNLASKTGVDGTFGFESLDVGSYKLDVRKALTTAETGSAINSADALAALKIAVGRNPNADPDGDGPLTAPPVSPYQFIAADANQDGKITSADALAILKMAVKRTDAPAREWLFVNENQDFWNEATSSLPGSFTTTKSSVLWDKVLHVSSPLTTQQNVVGVLKGDVNGSWTAPTGSQDLDLTTPSYFADLAAKLGTQVNQWAVLG